MALKRQVLRTENNIGGIFPNGYFRILESNVDKRSNKWRMRVGGYVDQEARLLVAPTSGPGYMGSDQRIISDTWYETTPTETTSLAEAYTFLKTQTFFENATDVLEGGQA